MALKAACFDFDGTLFNSDRVHLLCWNKAMATYSTSITHDEYSSQFAGRTTLSIATAIVKSRGLNAEPANIAETKSRAYLEWVRENTLEPMHYATEAVRDMLNHGLKVAVVTGSMHDEVSASLEAEGIMPTLECVVARDDVKHSKPDPESYLRCLGILGVKPDECITFEDTQSGVTSAKDAGIYCVAVENEFSRGHTLSEADHVCENLEEAVEWVADTFNLSQTVS